MAPVAALRLEEKGLIFALKEGTKAANNAITMTAIRIIPPKTDTRMIHHKLQRELSILKVAERIFESEDVLSTTMRFHAFALIFVLSFNPARFA